MFQNSLKLAWRHLFKNGRFTFLNIAGLSVSLASAILIYLWIYDELHIDKFHENDSRLYEVRINNTQADRIVTSNNGSIALGESIKKDFPEVEYAVTTTPASWFRSFNISYKGDAVKCAGNFVGRDYFNVFSYHLVTGTSSVVLKDKNAIVISEGLAKKIFPGISNDKLIGKILEWKWASLSKQSVITGIYKDFPVASTTQYDFVMPLESWNNIMNIDPAKADLSGGPFNTFLLLDKAAKLSQFKNKIAGVIKGRVPGSSSTIFLTKYSEAYLYDNYENGQQSGGRIEYVKMFTAIAICILLIACINFTNLSTSAANERIKQISINKTLGAGKLVIVFQFLGEALIVSITALIFAILLVIIFLPQFNLITGKQVAARFDGSLIITVIGIALLTGLLAGSYPAFYLSRFKPTITLRGNLKSSIKELLVRKGLIIFQFSLSIIFIISFIILNEQVKFVQTKNPGYAAANVIYFEMQGKVAEKPETFLAELKNVSGVLQASSIQNTIILPTYTPAPGVYWDGKNADDNIRFYQTAVNYELIETLGITMIRGRTFSRNFASDTNAVILNAAAANTMALKDPIGKTINIWGKDRHIVGITENFHFNSLHEEIKPFIFRLEPRSSLLVMAKISRGKEKESIQRIREYYKTFNPGISFDYKFLDEDYQAQYASEKLVAWLSQYFSGLAIFVSMLGLSGLALFTAQRRRKEIGIRKVIGASVASILFLFSKDFLKLIFLSILVAFPLSWWIMNKWLQGFNYRINMGLSEYFTTAIFVILITLLTIGTQALKAASANPVKSLKSE